MTSSTQKQKTENSEIQYSTQCFDAGHAIAIRMLQRMIQQIIYIYHAVGR